MVKPTIGGKIPLKMTGINTLDLGNEDIDALPVILVGSLQAGGEGAGASQPVLVKQQTFLYEATSTGFNDIFGDIAEWLGADVADLERYEIDVTLAMGLLEKDSSNDVNVRLYNGATEGEEFTFQDVGKSATNGDLTHTYHPTSSKRTLQIQAPGWTINVENWWITVKGFRLPDVVLPLSTI